MKQLTPFDLMFCSVFGRQSVLVCFAPLVGCCSRLMRFAVGGLALRSKGLGT